MKICTEQDCLRAHFTLIKKTPRGRNSILRKLKQTLAAMFLPVRFGRENHRQIRGTRTLSLPN